jgi:cytochrome b subunit of formate dehydrogenase
MTRRPTLELGAGLIFAIFGCMSAAYGVYSLAAAADHQWLLAIPPVLTMALIVALSRFQRRIEALPADPKRPDIERYDARNRRVFATINLVMILAAIAAVKLWLNAEKPDYITPTVAVIVGLHFVALAKPMEMRIYTIAGILLCVGAAGVMLASPPPGWAAFIGLGGGLILWASYWIQLREVWKGLRRRDSAF